MPCRPFRHVVLIAVLTLWSAASAHCTLEAIGWIPTEVAEDGCCATATACADDACEIVEDSEFSGRSIDLKAPAPLLTAEFCLHSAGERHLIPPEESRSLVACDAGECCRSWVPTRHFDRRTALPARAPDHVA